MYQVVDEIYDEYLDRTKATRPAEKKSPNRSQQSSDDDQKLQKNQHLKQTVVANCTRKLEIKNRKRIKQFN